MYIHIMPHKRKPCREKQEDKTVVQLLEPLRGRKKNANSAPWDERRSRAYM
jgi:hypothetical protein